MMPLGTDVMDDSLLEALWQTAASTVVDQLSDLLGARLVLLPVAITRGAWPDFRSQLPVSLTAVEVTLQGDYQGKLGLLWAVAEAGATDEWLNNDDIRVGLWDTVASGISQGLQASTGCHVTLSPASDPVTGTPDQPVGVDNAASGVMLTWEASGDGVNFYLGVIAPDETLAQFQLAPPMHKQQAGPKAQVAMGSQAPASSERVQARPPRLPELQANHSSAPRDLDLIMDLPLHLTVEIGSTRMLIKDVLSLGKGSVVELNRLAGELVDVRVNGKLLAKGEIVVLPDGNFGVRVAEIINASDRLRNLQAGQ